MSKSIVLVSSTGGGGSCGVPSFESKTGGGGAGVTADVIGGMEADVAGGGGGGGEVRPALA